MIRHVVPHLVAGAVALFLVREGLAPEFLGDALFHYPANLAAGRIAFDADGQVSKAFAAKELEAFFRQDGGAALDVLLLGQEGDGVVIHRRSFCVTLLNTPLVAILSYQFPPKYGGLTSVSSAQRSANP